MRIARPSTLLFHAFLAVILGGGLAVIGEQGTPLGGWIGLAPVLVIGWLGARKPLRRWRLAHRAFPEAWRAWLWEHVPSYAALPPPRRQQFERDVRFIYEEWLFEGVGEVEATETLRLSVAAGAALLLNGRPDWELPARHTVLFYPGSFDDDYQQYDDGAFDGMAHQQGPVILVAGAVEHGWKVPYDGSNVVLHELAHLFDFGDDYTDGAPTLMDPASVPAWSRLVRREMQRARLGKGILRRYASTNPAELFAVAVENFFERPQMLARHHPELFEALAAFFNQVPPVGNVAETAAEGTGTHDG